MTDIFARRLYGLGCLAIAAVSIIVGRRNLGAFVEIPKPPTEAILQPVLMPGLTVVPQSAARRSFVDVHLQLTNSFKATLNASPARIIRSPGGTVLVLDLNDSTVKEYAESGELIHKYSNNSEEMPGQVIDFALEPDGSVWMTDPNSDLLNIKQDGSVSHRLPQVHAHRLAWVGDRLLVLTVPSPALHFGDKLFLTLSSDGELLARFGELVADNAHFGSAVIGQPTADSGSKAFVYAPYRAGLLACLTLDGKLQYLVQTIQPLPLPQLQVMPSGAIRASSPEGTLDVAVANDLIFVLSATPNENNGSQAVARSIVDVYTLDSGEYKYSFTLPLKCSVLAVWNTTLYAASRNLVYEWVASQHF
jgi:hypothetical protein